MALESRDAKPWLDLIADAQKCFQHYHDKCDNIEKLYGDLKELAEHSTEREFQIFWANLEVLKPSLYARPPVPVVMPRFKDYKELPRKAAEILERTLITSFEIEDIDATMRLVRDDLALTARGTPWLRLDDAEGQKVRYDHVDRKDFLHDPARKWKEVDWVARRAWLSRQQAVERFGEGVLEANFDQRGLQYSEGESQSERNQESDYKGEKKAAVWEIWHKSKNVVVWVSKGVEDILDVREPFLQLEGFFPCPKPAYGTIQTGTLIPIPDFLYYRDQVEEINELTARISALSEALRMKGFYASGSEDVAEAIETAMRQMDNNALLIPVSNFAAMGGASLKDSIIWLPVVEIASTIENLVALRRQLIEDIYQITGLSDIMRGDTDARETLGAQQLKSQYGSIRIRDRQNELIRIARDMTRMAAEIMAENFDPQTLLDMSQVDDVPEQVQIDQQIAQIQSQVEQAVNDPRIVEMAQQNPQQAQQIQQQVQGQIQQLEQTVTLEKIMGLLREQRIRPFVLEIETDSTIQPDEDAEKQRTNEFMAAVGGFISQAGPMVQQEPATAPFVAEMLKFVASKYRAGRELEGTIEEFADAIKQRASQPQQQGPTPEQIAAQEKQADTQMRQQEQQVAMQMKQQELQGKLEFEKIKLAADMEAKSQDRQLELELGTAKLEIEKERINLEAQKLNLETDFKGRDLDLKFAQADGVIKKDGNAHSASTALAEMLSNVSQQMDDTLLQVSDQLTRIEDKSGLPRRIVKKNGKIDGVMIGDDEFHPVIRDKSGEIAGLGTIQ